MLSSLNLPRVDLVIVTPPDVSDDATLESLEPLWRALENAVGQGEVLSLGLADVSYQLFRDLYNWAKVGLIVHSGESLNFITCIGLACLFHLIQHHI